MQGIRLDPRDLRRRFHRLDLAAMADNAGIIQQDTDLFRRVADDFFSIEPVKDGAKMIMTQVGCSVPKFTVIVGGSFGAGNYGMCGRAFDGRFLWMWPQSQIAVMGAEQAANTLADVKIRQLQREGQQLSEEDIEAIRQPVLDSFQAESDAYYSSSELWDDGILDPLDTRNALGMAIIASLNAPFGDPGYGVLRL